MMLMSACDRLAGGTRCVQMKLVILDALVQTGMREIQ